MSEHTRPRKGTQTKAQPTKQTNSQPYTGKKSGKSYASANQSSTNQSGKNQSGKGQQDTGKHVTSKSKPKVGHSSGPQKTSSHMKADAPKSRTNMQAFQRQRPSAADAEELRPNDQIVVTIKRLGINGEGVGYYRRKAVFITGALPNEVVKAKVDTVQQGFIQATLTEIEKRSAHRIDAPCPVFGECGGCQIQHMSYEGQLEAKTDIVREAFNRYAGLDSVPMKPMLGMEHPWDYRNKAQLQVTRRQGEVIAGLYEMNSHTIVDISGCPIQHPKVNQAVAATKQVLDELRIPLYKDQGNREGIRTIVVRHGFQSDQLQVTLVSAGSKLPQQEQLIRRLRQELPQMSGLSLNINSGKTHLVFGDRTHTLWGTEAMEESLGDLEFRLSPRAFFQLNPQQTVKLYESVRIAAALTGKETVVDAYCGTGTIGLWLAPYASEVRGIEVIPEAVEDAARNARLNGRDNATFYTGEAEALLPRWVKSGFTPDVIIADPPRTGLDRRFLETILRTKPQRFVYVSCNPSTLAKDAKVLLDGGYELQWIQPVDMFPQTSHVECCSLFVRKG